MIAYTSVGSLVVSLSLSLPDSASLRFISPPPFHALSLYPLKWQQSRLYGTVTVRPFPPPFLLSLCPMSPLAEFCKERLDIAQITTSQNWYPLKILFSLDNNICLYYANCSLAEAEKNTLANILLNMRFFSFFLCEESDVVIAVR